MTWERPKVRYKRNSFYPGSLSKEMKLFLVPKFVITVTLCIEIRNYEISL